ncbi:MAG TPA: DUF1259 domain-containing protein [Thermoanaerobaculia bacterium]|nr:DUF1259 domain-containing protein [Thermoanaerobaculia bacterium]
MKNALFAAILSIATSAFAADPAALDAILGRAGAPQPGGVTKYSFPRTDLAVTVGGVRIRPALALGSWAAFNGSMVMGDLVLTENEVNAVISALQAGGIDQTAVHNHLLHETPRVVYMHFEGHGDAATLARAFRAGLQKTKTPLAAATQQPAPAPLNLPVADLDRILGAAGKANGGVDQFSIPRADRIMEGEMEIPPSMGVATAINVQPIGLGRAVVTGDFVLTAGEVNGVIRALRNGAIEVTALHSHMLTEEPRLFFMHFWGNGDAVTLAKTLRSALDVTNVKRAPSP